MSKIVSISNKHRGSIPAFMTWFEYIEKNNVKVKDMQTQSITQKTCNQYSNK